MGIETNKWFWKSVRREWCLLEVIIPQEKNHLTNSTMHHFVTEICTYVHISVIKWCIVGYASCASWKLCSHTTVCGCICCILYQSILWLPHYEWIISQGSRKTCLVNPQRPNSFTKPQPRPYFTGYTVYRPPGEPSVAISCPYTCHDWSSDCLW